MHRCFISRKPQEQSKMKKKKTKSINGLLINHLFINQSISRSLIYNLITNQLIDYFSIHNVSLLIIYHLLIIYKSKNQFIIKQLNSMFL